MKKLTACFVFVFLLHQDLPAQNQRPRKGPLVFFVAGQEFMWNRPDRVFTGYMARKTFFGVGLSDRQQKFLWFTAIGAKGFKAQVFSPRFSQGFKTDFAGAYVPATSGQKDSLAGAALYEHSNGRGNSNLFGTYTLHAMTGIRLTAFTVMPVVSWHVYAEDFPFYADVFRQINSNSDIEWLALNSLAQEIRFGFTLLPFRELAAEGLALDFEVGYKWVKYAPLNLDGARFDRFTRSDFTQQYAVSRKLTFGLHLALWIGNGG